MHSAVVLWPSSPPPLCPPSVAALPPLLLCLVRLATASAYCFSLPPGCQHERMTLCSTLCTVQSRTALYDITLCHLPYLQGSERVFSSQLAPQEKHTYCMEVKPVMRLTQICDRIVYDLHTRSIVRSHPPCQVTNSHGKPASALIMLSSGMCFCSENEEHMQGRA